jgi:hypothetical protein
VSERDLNIFTHHVPNSTAASQYYVFAAQEKVDNIASSLVNGNHGQ